MIFTLTTEPHKEENAVEWLCFPSVAASLFVGVGFVIRCGSLAPQAVWYLDFPLKCIPFNLTWQISPAHAFVAFPSIHQSQAAVVERRRGLLVDWPMRCSRWGRGWSLLARLA